MNKINRKWRMTFLTSGGVGLALAPLVIAVSCGNSSEAPKEAPKDVANDALVNDYNFKFEASSAKIESEDTAIARIKTDTKPIVVALREAILNLAHETEKWSTATIEQLFADKPAVADLLSGDSFLEFALNLIFFNIKQMWKIAPTYQLDIAEIIATLGIKFDLLDGTKNQDLLVIAARLTNIDNKNTNPLDSWGNLLYFVDLISDPTPNSKYAYEAFRAILCNPVKAIQDGKEVSIAMPFTQKTIENLNDYFSKQGENQPNGTKLNLGLQTNAKS